MRRQVGAARGRPPADEDHRGHGAGQVLAAPLPPRLAARAGTRLTTRTARWLVAGLFVALLAAFAAGIWGTMLRPAAWEVRGTIASRPAPNLILVNHEAVEGLGMAAMELMAIFGEPALLDAAHPTPGDRVRLAVRREDDRLVLLRIEKLR